MAENAAALIGSGLHKRFLVKETGQTIGAVTDVSLEIPVGTLTALVGPDGAGKTTLLRMMAGLMVPDEGRLEVLGIDVAADPQAVQDRISYMPQRFGLYEDLSVQENLDLYADLHGVPSAVRSERYRRLLHMTNLAPFTSRPAGKLSGGMKQKLGLACTLVRSPELLLLDEPTVGVDPLSRVELWEIILQMIRDEHLTVLITTAYLDEAERCAQVFVLHEGKLLTSGAPADIRAHARGRCFVATPSRDQSPRLLQARLLEETESIIDAIPHGGAVRFVRRAEADQQRLATLLDGARVVPVEPRLEDGFMVLLRSGQAAHPEQAVLGTPHSLAGTALDRGSRNRGEGPGARLLATSSPWTTSRFPSAAARFLACLGQMAPVKPPPSACCAGFCLQAAVSSMSPAWICGTHGPPHAAISAMSRKNSLSMAIFP